MCKFSSRSNKKQKTSQKPSEVDIIKLSELLGHYRFQKREQLPNESIKDYVTALRTLAKDCNFGNVHSTTAGREASGSSAKVQSQAASTILTLRVMLQDRLVCEIHHSQLQQWLLTENKRTIKIAYELELMTESAKNEHRQIQGSQTQADTFDVNCQHFQECITSKPPQCF